MYLGKSAPMVKKAQSWPIWAATNAQTGHDVNILLYGVFLYTWQNRNFLNSLQVFFF